MMPECNNLFMRLALGMFGAGFVVVVISGLGLVWDGAYQLVYVLENSVVRVGYGRFTQGAIFAAVLALSRFTDNVNALTWAFGALHAALPLTALLGAWVILRDRAAWRFVWIALGIGLVTLPAQACLVCQSVAVGQINWILIAAILVGMPRTGVVFSLIAIPIMFFYHPVAIVCFAVDALLALWAGLRSPETRHRMFICCGCFALLTFAAVLRMQVFSNEYEAAQTRLGVWVWTFLVGVGGAPPHAILLTWLAGALLVLERFAGRFSMALWSIVLFVIAIAFILLGLWAHDTADWQYALEFRGWAIWLSLPVVILLQSTVHPHPLHFGVGRLC